VLLTCWPLRLIWQAGKQLVVFDVTISLQNVGNSADKWTHLTGTRYPLFGTPIEPSSAPQSRDQPETHAWAVRPREPLCSGRGPTESIGFHLQTPSTRVRQIAQAERLARVTSFQKSVRRIWKAVRLKVSCDGEPKADTGQPAGSAGLIHRNRRVPFSGGLWKRTHAASQREIRRASMAQLIEWIPSAFATTYSITPNYSCHAEGSWQRKEPALSERSFCLRGRIRPQRYYQRVSAPPVAPRANRRAT